MPPALKKRLTVAYFIDFFGEYSLTAHIPYFKEQIKPRKRANTGLRWQKGVFHGRTQGGHSLDGGGLSRYHNPSCRLFRSATAHGYNKQGAQRVLLRCCAFGNTVCSLTYGERPTRHGTPVESVCCLHYWETILPCSRAITTIVLRTHTVELPHSGNFPIHQSIGTTKDRTKTRSFFLIPMKGDSQCDNFRAWQWAS
ncbi:hypothetical protein D3OALGA1CA_3256 [Olavius algarvensis associated proteobacterium Delta 3]|nr:hypothetical protein D3OALGB2SA_1847 [Olavius algarvensis associated proteobacterium Delta 3]CAB5131459.1 hypothetical protein D3OALGA1CA_3256 [Olavius algarvensis associated proteobacterium Delta 3]